MDLEEAGLPAPDSIDAKTGSMTIKLEESQVEEVKKVIAAGQTYEVTAVEQIQV